MTTGERIRAARKRLGLTQEQLAKNVGVATITIRQYELNKRRPSYEQMRKLADALEVSFLYLIENQGIFNSVDEAANDHAEAKKNAVISAGTKTILETLYGKCRRQEVSGKWLTMRVSIYGTGEKSTVIYDEDFCIINDAVKALVISLVNSLGKDAEAEIKNLEKDLSGPDAEVISARIGSKLDGIDTQDADQEEKPSPED